MNDHQPYERLSHRPTYRVGEAAALSQPGGGAGSDKDNATPTPAGAAAHAHRRLTPKHRPCLAAELTDRDVSILTVVSQLRAVSGEHIRRLWFHDGMAPANARAANRCLRRLVDHGFLVRLTPRRVGGVVPGSEPAAYALNRAGALVLGLTGHRRPAPPTERFARHVLAVAEIFVKLREAERQGVLELLSFTGEPGCWRPHTAAHGGRSVLKPDAAVVLGVGEWEHHAFIEVDRGTVSVGTLAAQVRAYLAYAATGAEQVAHDIFPAIVWLVPSPERAAVVQQVVRRQVPEALRPLLRVGLLADAVTVLTEDGQ